MARTGSEDKDKREEALSLLVPKAQAGNNKALEALIREIYPPVLRYVRVRIAGHKTPTAEDVAQEICLGVSQALPRYKDTGRPFMAFVYGIAFNKVTDAHRALSRDRLYPAEEMPEIVDTSHTPEQFALDLDASNRMRSLLDSLNDKAREILTLRVFVGLSAEETAEIVGSTAGAVRVAQHRALATLRKKLEKEGGTS